MRWALPFVVLLAAQPAWALQPSKHRELAEAACTDVRLPAAYCARMGKEAFETDYHEWTNLSAHAQRELGQDRCTAADAALARVYKLAREAIAKTRGGQHEAGAIALGRAMHTLQDECSHHGMTNEEHAFYSVMQTCTRDDVSPDVQPEAIACADARTREVFTLVAAALVDTRWDGVAFICRDFENNDSCQTATLPGPWHACDFLALHHDWDGEDSRWDGARMGASLVASFRAGLAGEPAVSVCGGDPRAIDPTTVRAPVTNREAGCRLTDLLCLGKVDDAGEASAESGCSTGRGASWLVLIALALVVCGRSRARQKA